MKTKVTVKAKPKLKSGEYGGFTLSLRSRISPGGSSVEVLDGAILGRDGERLPGEVSVKSKGMSPGSGT